MRRDSRRSVLFAMAMTSCVVSACEAEIGSVCDSDRDKVNREVEQTAGTNNLVSDVVLENCTAGFCVSTADDTHDGSRPYCTAPCQTDADCSGAGDGFHCDSVISFGPLACTDFEDPAAEQPARQGQSSGSPCEHDEDCDVAGESCFIEGDRAGTCGFVGRDCATGPDGAASAHPILYCAARTGALVARDR